MTDRASVLADPGVAALLRERLVPVAVDQHIHRRLRSAEGRYFRSLVRQAGRDPEFAQGFYGFTPGGRLMAFRHTHDPREVSELLEMSLEGHAGRSATGPDAARIRRNGDGLPLPPEGGLVLDVVTKVLNASPRGTPGPEGLVLPPVLGRDHAWIRADEASLLARGVLPETVIPRLVRYHFVDNTRGEPPLWRNGDVRALSAALDPPRLAGRVRLESAGGERGYAADLAGVVEARSGEVVRFDAVALGLAWGEGEYNPGAPPGRFPLAVRFRLARAARPMDRVPPGGARRTGLRRGVRRYLDLEEDR